MTNVLTPTYRMAKTILAIQRELQIYTGCAPTYDVQTTLNSKFNRFNSLVPTTVLPTAKYFCIGINGYTNSNDTNGSLVNEVNKTDMGLYTMIPFRCVPVEQDLDAPTRLNYRMRVRETLGSAGNTQDYYSYYLKMISYIDGAVQLTQTDPTSKQQIPYTIDYANLSPTVPTPPINGVVSNSQIEVNATVGTSLPISGAEVVEALTAKYNNLGFRVSEMGIVSGFDQVIQDTDGNGNQINLTEALFAQLNAHYTWLGADLSNSSATMDLSCLMGSGDCVLLA